MARKPAPTEGDRRSQILAAALEVFSERGLEGATNTAIAARAQVTHGLIYFYFPSKEDLFCAAVEYQADHVFAQLDLASERASADPPEQTLRRIVSRFVAVMEEPAKREPDAHPHARSGAARATGGMRQTITRLHPRHRTRPLTRIIGLSRRAGGAKNVALAGYNAGGAVDDVRTHLRPDAANFIEPVGNEAIA